MLLRNPDRTMTRQHRNPFEGHPGQEQFHRERIAEPVRVRAAPRPAGIWLPPRHPPRRHKFLHGACPWQPIPLLPTRLMLLPVRLRCVMRGKHCQAAPALGKLRLRERVVEFLRGRSAGHNGERSSRFFFCSPYPMAIAYQTGVGDLLKNPSGGPRWIDAARV
jgi:hypothetical protein